MSTNSAAADSSPALQIISASVEIFSSIESSSLVSGVCEKSIVSMQDFRLIGDFVGRGKAARLPRLHALGDEAAEHIGQVLPKALS